MAPYDKVVVLTFESFELEPHDDCGYDSLEAFDGLSPLSSKIGGKICGSGLPPPVWPNGSLLFLQFTTDATETARGFKISYKRSNYCRKIYNFNVSPKIIFPATFICVT